MKHQKKMAQSHHPLRVFRKGPLTSFPHPSPAARHSCRIAPFDETRFLVASNNSIVTAKIRYPPIAEEVSLEHEGCRIPTPVRLESLQEKFIEKTISTSHEIQNLVIKHEIGTTRLAVVDNRCNAWISSLEASDDSGFADIGSLEPFRLGQPSSDTEDGWAGVTFHPSDSTQIATAGFWSKKLTLYSEDRVSRVVNTIANPTQIQFFASPHTNSSLLLVTENNLLTVWDLRSPTPCIRRVSSSTGTSKNYLYALACRDKEVAVGGTDRTVSFIDTKGWCLRSHARNALKYEIISLNFSSVDERLCFVGGMGAELACVDSSDKVPRENVFRGDSRWLGLQKLDLHDTLFGYSDSGQVYLFQNASSLHALPPTTPSLSSSTPAIMPTSSPLLSSSSSSSSTPMITSSPSPSKMKRRHPNETSSSPHATLKQQKVLHTEEDREGGESMKE